MLSEKIESLADWAQVMLPAGDERDRLIARLNEFAADAHALERTIVPFHARVIEESDKVVDLSRRRVARPWPGCR